MEEGLWWYVVLAACAAAGHMIGGNLLAGTHGAAHSYLSQHPKGEGWRAHAPRILHPYVAMHLAHHLVERHRDRLGPITCRAYMGTPAIAWIGVIMCGNGLLLALLATPLLLGLSVSTVTAVWLALWLGCISFFALYELVHARTHQANAVWLVSRLHRAHHRQWNAFYGIYWWSDLLPRYGLPLVMRSLSGLRWLEDRLLPPGLARRLETAGTRRLATAKALAGVTRG